MKALPRAQGVDELTVPGERGDRIFAERGRTGIPIPPAIWKQLDELAAKFGVPLPTRLPSPESSRAGMGVEI